MHQIINATRTITGSQKQSWKAELNDHNVGHNVLSLTAFFSDYDDIKTFYVERWLTISTQAKVTYKYFYSLTSQHR